jgi:hypothetical protein
VGRTRCLGGSGHGANSIRRGVCGGMIQGESDARDCKCG